MQEIPIINQIAPLSLIDYKTVTLDNGIPVIILESAEPDIVKMDVVFNAGRFREKHRAVAKTTAIMITEGTTSMNSAEISKTIDYYGATITSSASMDTATIQLFSMGKHFINVIPILKDILTKPIFPEIELKKFKSRSLEKLKIELSKNSVLAYRYFTEVLYGSDHPYGYNTKAGDYINIGQKKLQNHYNNNYIPNNCKIFITGNVTKDILNLLNDNIGSINNRKVGFTEKNYKLPEINQEKLYYNNDRIHQTALRLGRRMFDRSHEDYAPMYLLNTILGGYFGSRLSANLREDKGYTYGVSSGLDMMLKDGYFTVSTEVGNEYVENTLLEIYKELDILRNKLVEDSELNLVKNYIKGNFLSLVNGPLNSINLIKTIELSGLKKTFFIDFIKSISETNADKLMEMANKYLQEQSLTEVRVGLMS